MMGGLNPARTRANPSGVLSPQIGHWVPTATVHLAFLGVSVGLCALVLDDFRLVGGLLLAVTGTFVPHFVPRWCVIILLALSQLWREPSVTDPVFYLLLAGVHLLHVTGSLAALMPWRGRMQTVAFVRPLRRFVLVQIVVQATAVATLLSFGGGHGSVPGLSILAALVLGAMAAGLGRALRRARGNRVETGE